MIQHPDITAIERNGYPSDWIDPDDNTVYCDVCGSPLEQGERYYHIRGENICVDCLEDYEEFA